MRILFDEAAAVRLAMEHVRRGQRSEDFVLSQSAAKNVVELCAALIGAGLRVVDPMPDDASIADVIRDIPDIFRSPAVQIETMLKCAFINTCEREALERMFSRWLSLCAKTMEPPR